MSYRVTVATRSGDGYGHAHDIESPDSVQIEDGNLLIRTKPYEGHPGVKDDPARPGVFVPRRRATKGSLVVYPEGQWQRATVTDFIDDNVVTNPTL